METPYFGAEMVGPTDHCGIFGQRRSVVGIEARIDHKGLAAPPPPPPELAGREFILEKANLLFLRVLAERAEKSFLMVGAAI